MSSADVPAREPIVLANEAMEIAFVPLGGQIVCLRSRATGREWLWKNPHLPSRTIPASTRDFGPNDTGGWDEIFPSVAPCTLADTPWGQQPIADHGELWHRVWRIDARNQAASGGSITLAVDEPRLPFRFVRKAFLAEGQGPLVLDYAVENLSKAPLPFLWAAHPLIAVEPGMTIRLPAGSRMTCAAAIGFALGQSGDRFTWPCAALSDGTAIDFSCVPTSEAIVAAKLFSDKLADGWAEVISTDGGESLKLSFDIAATPHLGLWLNYGAWSGAGTPAYFNCGLEPTTSPFDLLHDARDDGRAVLLQPGTRWAWQMSVRFVVR